MSRLSSADTATDDAAETEEAPRDELREELLARLGTELGDGLVDSHIRPGDDLWVRVTREAWVEAAVLAKDKLHCVFFDFLSGLDWLPSPYGRDMDSQEDLAVHGREEKEPPVQETGYAGGDTRFQVFSRLYAPAKGYGITFKADLPDDDLSVRSLVGVFAGANWHERECAEMYGFSFLGHPDLQNLYLPSGFEGFPLRKDFPLLSRRIKPWPGIVDVEPMPGEDDDEEAGEGGDG